MKLIARCDGRPIVWSHPARGAWIEMPVLCWYRGKTASHPARGAWIEMALALGVSQGNAASHPARGAWIEITRTSLTRRNIRSHPARGAWIEILIYGRALYPQGVAPRTGCVD